MIQDEDDDNNNTPRLVKTFTVEVDPFHQTGAYKVAYLYTVSDNVILFQGNTPETGNEIWKIQVATTALQELFQGHAVPLADAVVIAGVVALDVMDVSTGGTAGC